MKIVLGKKKYIQYFSINEIAFLFDEIFLIIFSYNFFLVSADFFTDMSARMNSAVQTFSSSPI